jgi:Lrp/AsnC family transcriptional regulator
MVDRLDRKILQILQEDATVPVAEIGRRVGLSTTPCWRRIQKLEEDGVITRRVALLDPAKMNVGLTVFIAIRTNQHSLEWLTRFQRAIDGIPEIVEVYRMSGQIDYLLRAVVPDIAAYDAVYKRIIQRIELSDVTSMMAMEVIKRTTVLPVSYAE